MMPPEAALAIIRLLDDLSIPYMLVGSLSSNIYGITRSTLDADLVIELVHVRLANSRRRLVQIFAWTRRCPSRQQQQRTSTSSRS